MIEVSKNWLGITFTLEELEKKDNLLFEEGFKKIIEIDTGKNNIVLLNQKGNFGVTYFFPESVILLYRNYLTFQAKIERRMGPPKRPFSPVFATDKELDYWRETLNWDKTID